MNPYLDEFDPYCGFDLRRQLCFKYAYAVPNGAAITAIAKHSPIIEIGAGSGYWARLLTEAGATVVAYDDGSWGTPFNNWYPVQPGGPATIRVHPDHTLFLCWPPLEGRMARDCLRFYTGQTLLAVTEGPYGCCGNNAFWDEIKQHWKLIRNIAIPQYIGIHDRLEVYERL